jgi:tripartite-type tricarboxylate transporter receptor subunit TctC
MRISRRRFATVPLLALAAPALHIRAVSAQAAWPTKPVRVVNPYTPGGTTEVLVRLLAERFERTYGQPMVGEHRPGAGGSVGAAYASQQPADGYTLLITTTGPQAVAQALFPNRGYDVVDSFTYITLWGGAPIVLAVKGDSPMTDLASFIVAAKARPGAITYGSSGPGSVGHLTGVLFAQTAGVQLMHVPYRGAPEPQAGVMSGEIVAMFDTIGAHAAQVRAGGLRALAFSGPERAPLFPAIPTMKESGLAAAVATNWFVMAGPKNLPSEMVTKVNAVAQAILKDPTAQERIAALGLQNMGDPTPRSSSPSSAPRSPNGPPWSRHRVPAAAEAGHDAPSAATRRRAGAFRHAGPCGAAGARRA